MDKLLFNEGAGKLMSDLVESCGDDLIYSLAYQRGSLFLIVSIDPDFTTKKFTNDEPRLLVEIVKNDLQLTQEELTSTLVEIVTGMIEYEA